MEKMTVAPERSVVQRMEALQRANDVRGYRAAIKQDIRHREKETVDVLATPEPELATMKVFELLLATPKVGRVKANKLLAQCRISPSKTVGGLSERQRGELVALLQGHRPVRRLPMVSQSMYF
jgi:hypothetical protein